MSNYTSLDLSKKIKESGCKIKLDHYKCWAKDCLQNYIPSESDKNCYKAYDLIWDICIKYPKEFFGTDYLSDEFHNDELWGDTACCSGSMAIFRGRKYQYFPQVIIHLLQQGKKEEAEQYFLNNSILFK